MRLIALIMALASCAGPAALAPSLDRCSETNADIESKLAGMALATSVVGGDIAWLVLIENGRVYEVRLGRDVDLATMVHNDPASVCRVEYIATDLLSTFDE